MFVKKDTRKIREIFEDESDDKHELYLARRKFEFPNGQIDQTMCQPHHVEKLSNLQYLSLYDNSLIDISGIGQLSCCVNLVELDLGLNHLTTLPDELGELTSLRSLSCEDNKLSGSLSNAICNLRELRKLSISRNGISSIPSSIQNLNKLEILVMDGNHLTTLPHELCELRKLQQLHVRGNQLTVLPDILGTLSSLSVLAVSSNSLENITDEAISGLVNLETLYANGNCLKTIPGTLADLPKLASVSFANNEIERLPPQLESWTPDNDGQIDPSVSVKIVFLGNPIANEDPYIDELA